MKTKAIISALGLALFCLCSCAKSSQSAVNPSSSEDASSSTATISSSEDSSSSSAPISSSEERNPDGVYDFYAINDFHGSILERYNGDYYEPGLSKLGGRLKYLKNLSPDNSFILSSGDSFQGSLESNYYYGMPVVEAMNQIGFSSMTLGNHEFDYGQDKLLALSEAADFPFLAGNIKAWENGAVNYDVNPLPYACSTTVSQGNVKVGIVGCIGSGQTTSITSKYVSDLSFVSPVDIAKDEGKRLREEEDCDIVILSLHDEAKSIRYESNLKDSFDAIFAAHSHDLERYVSSGVPILQGSCNGRYISHAQLIIEDGEVSCSLYENIQADESWEEDEQLNELLSTYLDAEEFSSLSEKKLGSIYGYLDRGGIARLGCKAIFEKYRDYDNDGEDDIVLAMQNSQRATLGSGGTTTEFTYSDLYKCTPFMNEITIIKATGSQIKAEARYNYSYSSSESLNLANNEYYEIAVIDYLAYHQNNSKEYDYFPSMEDSSNVLAEFPTYPVDLSAEYIVDTLGGKLVYSDFASTSPGFNSL